MSTTDLSSYNNSWYKPGSLLKRALWYMVNETFFKRGILPVYRFKVFLLRMFGAKVGHGVKIKPFVNIKYPWLLRIGNHVWIGEQVWIDSLGCVDIGDHCCISQGALLLCGNHDFTKRGFDLIVKPITLEAGVWIGAKALVAGGAVCRSHSVLTAGSVCSHQLEAYTIYRGNPAEPVKNRVIAR